jgi:hypothetical protein
MELFFETLIQYLAEVVGLVVVTAIGIFGSWLLNKMKQNKSLQNITLATEQVFSAAQSTVYELQQTLVEGWKRNQDGKLTPEQVEELRAKVLEITMAKLAEPTLKLLNGAKMDVAAMISSAAESYVLEMKGGV